jgi:hypothetical protein
VSTVLCIGYFRGGIWKKASRPSGNNPFFYSAGEMEESARRGGKRQFPSGISAGDECEKLINFLKKAKKS